MTKRCLILVMSLCLLWGVGTAGAASVLPEGVTVASYREDTDYLSLMEDCAAAGTPHAIMIGAIYERQRNLKIQTEGQMYEETFFFDCFDGEQILAEIQAYQTPVVQVAATRLPTVQYYSEEEVRIVAKIIYREARGIPSNTEKACVAWTICNRVDAGYAGSVKAVATAPNQFAYRANTPVTDELYWLAGDVLARWNREKNGESEVGRVLPPDYTHFTGNGKHNIFRNAYRGGTVWNYSWPSPYET